ncbi:MAG TPA: hypothetical protein VL328_17785 [Gemmatimonadaceae bacterium]|jgi:hypothetical protein|nr:hypothetical protein [Gemmatimonadaceae bacterium]
MRSPLVQHAADAGAAREPIDPVFGSFASLAEDALARAIPVQSRPSLDMFVVRSAAESDAIERAAREICSEAHRLDLRPEQLLIETKRAWSRLAGVRANHLGDRDGDVLREVVSACIEIYFGEHGIRAD